MPQEVSEPITVTILFFGILRDVVGTNRLGVEIQSASRVRELVQRLTEQFPPLEKRNILVAVNEKYADADTALNNGDEIALFTAVSGG